MSHSQQAEVSQEAVAGMMEMTQCTAQQAQFMLEASMGDMHRAMAMYYGEAGPVKAAFFRTSSISKCLVFLACSVSMCHTLLRGAACNTSQSNLLLTVTSCTAEESQLAASPPTRFAPTRVAATPPRPLAPLPGQHLGVDHKQCMPAVMLPLPA